MTSFDPHERILAAGPAVGALYESNYVKANAPEGGRAVWLKHTLVVSPGRSPYGEFWAVLFDEGRPVAVACRHVRWPLMDLDPRHLSLDAPGIRLRGAGAWGEIADIGWSLDLTAGQPPLFHLPHPALYRTPFPRTKLLTSVPNARFDGEIRLGERRWPVAGWIGLRGHNWGRSHAVAHVYLNCNLWADGSTDRTLEATGARIRIAGRTSPWLSVLVGRSPMVIRNRVVDWRTDPVVTDDVRLQWVHGGSDPVVVEAAADPRAFVGLRYRHPDGSEAACYNTKFAAVRWSARGALHTSDFGELEILRADPLPGVTLHPDPAWRQGEDGDYRGGLV